MTNTTLSVAVLGLGIMGRGMAENLIVKGFKVAVYNRNSARAEPFKGRARIAATSAEADRLTLALAKLRAEQAELAGQVVETRETAILQEAGIYQYRHPLQDAIAYKAKLTGL